MTESPLEYVKAGNKYPVEAIVDFTMAAHHKYPSKTKLAISKAAELIILEAAVQAVTLGIENKLDLAKSHMAIYKQKYEQYCKLVNNQLKMSIAQPELFMEILQKNSPELYNICK